LSSALAQQEKSFEQFVTRLEKIAINEDLNSLKAVLFVFWGGVLCLDKKLCFSNPTRIQPFING
jgi:hypothetical protein